MVAPGDLINKLTLLPQIPTLDSFVMPTLPEVKVLFNLLNLPGGAFQNPIAGPIGACLEEIVDLSDLELNPLNGPFLSAFGSASSALGLFRTHTNSAIAGLPLNMNPVIAGLKVTQSVGGGLSAGNPCSALNDIFGSILGDGANLVAALAAALAYAIAAVLPTEITDAISAILDAATAFIVMIDDEVQALADLLQLLQNFAAASSLTNLSTDPCAQALFNSAGTPGLLNALPNMAKF